MRAFLFGLLILAWPSFVRGGDRSTISPSDHTFQRAGMPLTVSQHAIPSVTKHDALGYVGGGKLIRGDGRGQNDGTFGSDYQGLGIFSGRIFLGWHHDRLKQPRAATYKVDGPRVPDPVSLHPVRKLLQKGE